MAPDGAVVMIPVPRSAGGRARQSSCAGR